MLLLNPAAASGRYGGRGAGRQSVGRAALGQDFPRDNAEERKKGGRRMNLILRWLLRIFGFAVIALALGSGLAWYLVSRSLPEYGGRLAMDGLEGEVRIIRDSNAVPHIRAGTDHDAFFALGVAHAQDRLWQMELSRRAAQGALSSLFGSRTLDVDRLVRASASTRRTASSRARRFSTTTFTWCRAALATG